MRLSPGAVAAVVALAAAAIGASALALGSRRTRRQVEIHRDWWAARTHTPPDDDAFHLVVLGDSAAQGVGVPDPARAYVVRVAERLATELDRPVATTNLSVSGATTADLIADQLPLLEGLRADTDLVVCVIGSNDVVRGDYEPAGFGARIEEIAAALPAGSVLGEVPCFGHPPWEPRVRRLNPLVSAAAQRHGHTVAELHGASAALWPVRILGYVAGDWFHPNARGYAVWADAIWAAVRATPAVRAATAARPASDHGAAPAT
ncbi:SGNH/GDSL hydrolase family protein [Georgenia sp. Z1344]|uniref:SGNH/GDSL hydrolase family protein n=1 Tax=Georgenia sp. Z1344 TaxID=3416706 RepID=UPI003CE675D0